MKDIDSIIAAMKQAFGTDQRRIEHALSVLAYAERILGREGGNRDVVLAAAVLHDIGIQEAERKYGSSAPKYQEIEGPPMARRILEDCRVLTPEDAEHVCRIVGSHHSARDIDTHEFDIVWDADWLVNFRDVYPCEFGTDSTTRGKQCVKRINHLFRTASARRIAMTELLPHFTADPTSAGGEDRDD
jgi:hypothetical protein